MGKAKLWAVSFAPLLALSLFSSVALAEEIFPQAQRLLDKYSQSNLVANGSVYQLGLYYRGEGTPYERGLTLVNNSGSPLMSYVELELSEQQQQFLCEFEQLECQKALLAISALAHEAIQQNQEIFDEYQGVYAYRYFDSISISTAADSYQLFDPELMGLNIQKINLVNLLNLLRAGDEAQAVNNFKIIIEHALLIMAQSPYLNEKIKSLLILDSAIHLFPYLYQQTKDKHLWGDIEKIFKPVTEAILAEEDVYDLEFASQVYLMDKMISENNLDKNDNMIDYLNHKLAFNRKKTINLMYECTVMGIKNEELLQRWSFINYNTDNNPHLVLDILNPVGSLLAMTSRPRFVSFAEDITKIRTRGFLINLFYSNRKTERFDGRSYSYETIENNKVCLLEEGNTTEICLNIPEL
ncbi:hypothetical protein STH12_02276 [Shewanella khirikhana]|uniref:Uncharacterized protein n=2 Tax=Shewanella khirikhana TaxID=1965282 RepID=A0ABM7DC30_9GAMM|nr:hypothetical protein STH12_02276 [Shewanella khirikhana]